MTVVQTEINELYALESEPVEFPLGLIGLEDWQQFSLVVHPEDEPLRQLQALDDERVSLIIANPWHIVPEYTVVLSEADAQALQYRGPKVLQADADDTEVYCILSVQAEPFNVTANLLGPVVINWRTGLGRQVILADTNYDPRFPIAGQSLAQLTACLNGD